MIFRRIAERIRRHRLARENQGGDRYVAWVRRVEPEYEGYVYHSSFQRMEDACPALGVRMMYLNPKHEYQAGIYKPDGSCLFVLLVRPGLPAERVL